MVAEAGYAAAQAAGFGAQLWPTMTSGAGFAGGSAFGETLRPEHLVNWTKIAFATEANLPAGLEAARA